MTTVSSGFQGETTPYSNACSVSVSNTKGGYTQLLASIAADASRWWVHPAEASSTAFRNWLQDVAVGAASSEVVILSNWWNNGGGNTTYSSAFLGLILLDVASGSRIASRVQADGTGIAMNVNVYFSDEALASIASVESYGQLTASSNAVQVEPGGTANTKGVYTELTATTTADLEWMNLAVNFNNAFPSNYTWAIDIATGAAASEVVVHSNLITKTLLGDDAMTPNVFNGLYEPISSGTRLAIRAACSGNDATDRLFRAGVYVGMLPEGGGGTTVNNFIALSQTTMITRGRMRAY